MIWIIQLSCLEYHRHECFRFHLCFRGKNAPFFAFIFYTFVERFLLMIITQKCSCKSHVCSHNWCDLPWTAKLNDSKIRKSIRSIRNLAVPPNASHETTGRWHWGGYQAWTGFAIISCPPPENHSQTGRGVNHHVSEAVEKVMMYSKPSKKGHECQKVTMLEICFCTFWTSRWNLGLWTIAASFAALFFSCWGGNWGQFTKHWYYPPWGPVDILYRSLWLLQVVCCFVLMELSNGRHV